MMKDRLLKWLVTAGETDQIAPKWLPARGKMKEGFRHPIQRATSLAW